MNNNLNKDADGDADDGKVRLKTFSEHFLQFKQLDEIYYRHNLT